MPTPAEYDMPEAHLPGTEGYIEVSVDRIQRKAARLKTERAKGPAGDYNEHMAPYGRKHPRGSPEEAAVEDFAFFVELYVNARLPAWYYRLSAAARLVPLLKPEWDGTGTPPARPIAVGGIERRFCCGLLVEIHAADFADYLGPDQVAVGITASVEKLVFGIRALLERRPDFACWQIDLRNAAEPPAQAAEQKPTPTSAQTAISRASLPTYSARGPSTRAAPASRTSSTRTAGQQRRSPAQSTN